MPAFDPEHVADAGLWGEITGESFFQELIETSPDGILVFDLDGRTIYANAAISDLYGVARSALGTFTVFDTLDDDGREQFRAHLASLRQGHINPTDVESQWIRRDGTMLWVLVRESALRAADGTLIGVLHRISDYSHRRATLDELRQAQADLADKMEQNSLLQGVASAANDANSLVQILGRGRDLLLLMKDWDRAVAFVVDDDVGLTRVYPVTEESDAEQADDAAHPERAARELEVAERAWRTGAKVWADGGVSLAFPITYLDRVHAVGVVTAHPPVERFALIEKLADQIALQLEHVLAREQTEQSLAEARDAAMAASQQKSDFLATVSHEIRTPLNGVLGLNALLLDTDLDDEQHRLARGINSSGQVLFSLINDILDFSKIEAGRIVIEQIDFELRTVLDEVALPIAGSAAAKGLGFDVSYDAAVPDVVRGDPTRISQVFANLLTNAVKFTDTGSVSVVVSSERSKDLVILSVQVTDTGIGIDRDTADVFAPFQQADASTTRVFGGSGLGLAISRELARAMGGDVDFRSTAGQGSTFWFSASVGHEANTHVVGAPSVLDVPELVPHRVLVVEDNEVNQLVAAGLLASLGHSTDVAGDGLVALEKIKEQSYDMIFMDVQMPRLDGYATTGRIRAGEAPNMRIPIVAMTANAIEGERERCLAAGMDDFLTKPVSRDDLARTLATWLADQRVAAVATRTSPSDALLLDRYRLAELRHIDGDESAYLDRVLDRFATNGPELLAAITRAETTAELQFAAHKLVGTASNIGLDRVAALALEIEMLADAGTTDGAAPIIEHLGFAVSEGLEALADYRTE